MGTRNAARGTGRATGANTPFARAPLDCRARSVVYSHACRPLLGPRERVSKRRARSYGRDWHKSLRKLAVNAKRRAISRPALLVTGGERSFAPGVKLPEADSNCKPGLGYALG